MNMYKVELKNMLKSLIIWTIIMAGIITLFMSMFPSMSTSGMSEIVKTKIDAIPEAMRKSFGLENAVDFSDLLQYFAYCAQYILIGNCIYAAILGINSLIKEESEGTIEFLYAQPISRVKIVMVKMLSTFTILYIFNIIIFLVTMLFFHIFKKEGYEYISQLVFMYKGMFLAQFIFWSIGFALSAIISKVSLATPTALGIFFTSYLLGIFSTIIEKLEWMKYLSPVQYVMPNELLRSKGVIDMSYIIISLIVIIISIVFTFYKYKNKDLKL
ncbi:ABC transporter permease subunit [Clostridium brassicae]|uniref:ABC transporter permease subunit n=1 Tax=Clostridium brassicae TaxID=2999072 RepID=A0ABT4D9K0_9CLOT|nr:ABC transporter permease subunit [Clostridium brassicae]MCY6958979.1 ABC transporter permease subunit [Clostridium brassicae]